MFQEGLHYNRRLEADLLGACLLMPDTFGTLYKLVEPQMFYYDHHQAIFSALHEMFELNRSIDIETACYYLIRTKGIESFNGQNVYYCLTVLTNMVCQSSHLPAHAAILREMYVEREMLRLQAGGWNPQGEGEEKVNDVIDRLIGLRSANVDEHDIGMDQGIIEMLAHQEQQRQRGGMGIPYGVRKLDNLNGGAQPGDFVILAARPAVGKTAFAGQTAVSMANGGHKIGFISLEMRRVAMMARLASIDTRTDFKDLYRGKYDDPKLMSDHVWPQLAARTAHLPIRLCDQPKMTTSDISAQLKKWKTKYGLDVAFVDYLQLIKPGLSKKSSTREQEIGQISRDLKIIALELQITLVALSQLSREITKRTSEGEGRFPRPSDLRESGSLEQDADVIFFLHSDYEIGRADADPNHRHFINSKWRNEESNLIIDMDWIGSQMRFAERVELPNVGSWRRVEDPAM